MATVISRPSETARRQSRRARARHRPDGTHVIILAGGLSTRMGRDKSRIPLGRNTLLNRIRKTLDELGVPSRILRKDIVERCGPLGGIFTALTQSTADRLLFLSCDMPFISREFLARLLAVRPRKAVFVEERGTVGFPFILSRDTIGFVESQISKKQFSLQALAKAIGAKRWNPPRKFAGELFNINTPDDLIEARLRLKSPRRRS